METLPGYIGIIFGLTTIITAFIFYRAAHKSKIVLFILLGWLALQSLISLKEFYTNTETIPPRFTLLVIPPFILILALFVTKAGKKFVDALDLRALTLLHTVRIIVEVVLFWLYTYKTIPQLMTFEGRNFDILSGITAPIAYYLFFTKKIISSKMLLTWNLICLGLLINIVVNAILSAPFPFQQFAFDQPNIAVMYFPFVWLPCCVVPLVFLSHVAAIRKLLQGENEIKSQNPVSPYST